MVTTSSIFNLIRNCLLLLYASSSFSSEYSLVADVNAYVEYNDNIFITSQPHDSVTGLIITPKLAAIVKEEHWEAELEARVRDNNYSDNSLDNNNKYFNLTGRYLTERNVFSLNANYDLDSNLTSNSTDFGISGQIVKRQIQSVTPQFIRLLTERLKLTVLYTYSDVDYFDAEGTGYTPYIINIAQVVFGYDLSEKDLFSVTLQGTDYASKNDLLTYQLLVARIGVVHELTELLSMDFSIGNSINNSTNLSTQSYDFLGNEVIVQQAIDSRSRNLVLDAGITKMLESGAISGRVSRSNSTNSFGGLNVVNQLLISYNEKISSLWSYNCSARYENITAVAAGDANTNRDVFFFNLKTGYTFTRNWRFNASYRYIMRKFTSDTSDARAPYSNRIYLGLTYNFPTLSTF